MENYLSIDRPYGLLAIPCPFAVYNKLTDDYIRDEQGKTYRFKSVTAAEKFAQRIYVQHDKERTP